MVIGLAVLLQAGSSAWAQEPTKTPSPKELWDAYPLNPDQVPPTATPSAEFRSSPSVTASAERGASPDGGGMPWLVVLLLAAPPVFAAGLLLVHRRNRARATPPPATTGEPPAPRRFQWRDYPEPARPAPPPPPVPGGRAPSLEVALEEERAAATTQAKHKELH